MTRGTAGLAVAVVGVVLLVVVGIRGQQSVPDFLGKRCADRGMERDSAGNRVRAYDCRESPTRLAAALADRHEPAERHSTPAGHFLRYGGRMVGISGRPGGGSRARVAGERGGYGFFSPYVGGWWGTYGGPGEAFRGGGPGAGK